MDSKNTFLTTPVAVLLGAVIISLAILVAGGVIKLGSKTAANVAGVQITPTSSPQAPTLTLDAIKNAFNRSQIKFGDSNKKLIILEIADPSCPYCSIAAGENSELNKQAGDRFKLVTDGGTYVAPVPEIKKLVKSGQASFAYLYTPGHGSGEMGTRAMYCAFEEGKFWEVHDLIMSAKGYDLLNNTVKNDKSKSQDLVNLLSSVVDPTFMKSCLESTKYDSRLKEDPSIATSIGAQGTPGFFINTTLFAGAYSYKDMEAAVKAALGQ